METQIALAVCLGTPVIFGVVLFAAGFIKGRTTAKILAPENNDPEDAVKTPNINIVGIFTGLGCSAGGLIGGFLISFALALFLVSSFDQDYLKVYTFAAGLAITGAISGLVFSLSIANVVRPAKELPTELEVEE